MGKTRRYIIGLVTFLSLICCCNGKNYLQEQVEQRKLLAPVIHKLHPSGYSGTVRILCIASGKPPPAVTWTVNDTIIEKTKHYDFKYENQSMLVITDTTSADSGTYKCHASNRFGKIFQELTLRIKGIGEFKPGFRQEDECQYRNVTIGRPFELACPPHTNAYGQEFKWVVNPLDVWKTGYPIDRLFQAPNGSLIFSYVKKSDIFKIERKGGLSCGLVNKFKIVPSVSIKLWDDGNAFTGTTKPNINVFMDTITKAVKGTSVKLLCGAMGKPHPKLTWFKNNKRIYPPLEGTLARDVVVEGKGMVIQFRSVKAEHEAKYKCVAKSKAGVDEREASLIVNLHVWWSERPSLHVHLNVREPITLQCIAQGKPKPTYKWMHNDTEIISTSSRKIKDGLLEIPVSTFNDAGFYLCIAENSVNKKVTASYVNVKAFPPSFLTSFKEINYFFTGTRNTLHCNVNGGPKPALQWYHNGKSLGDDALKVFPSAGKSNNGVYKCTASNVKGNVEATTVVKVFDQTLITKGPAHFSFEARSVANLFCEADYDNTINATIEWLRNGQVITYDDRVHLKKGINWHSNGLQIVNLQAIDAGTYTCRVFTQDDKSFRSQDEKTGSITITGIVGKPGDVKLVGDCGDKEISLTWSAPSKYIGPVSHYVIEYSHVDDSSKSYRYKTPGKITATSYTIKTEDLPAASKIRFCVKAVSFNKEKEVISESCDQTDTCTVAFGAPFAAPMGLKAELDNNGSIIVSWDKFDEIFQSGKNLEIVGTFKEIVNGKEINAKEERVPGDGTSFKIPIGDVEKNDDGKYEIAVWAENEEGAGPKTELTIEHPGNIEIPPQVANVKIDEVTDTTCTLRWDPVDSVSDYTIYYYESTKSRRRRVAVDNTKKRLGSKKVTGASGTIDGLKPSNKYEITVAAQNVKGEGDESEPVKVKTAPGKPKDVDLNTYGDAIVLTWKPEEDDDVTGYDVTWYPSGETDPAKKKTKTLPPDAKTAFITSDLEPLKYYTVELNKKSDDGKKGKPWKMVGVVVGKPDQPGKPADPTLVGLNESTIIVIFNLPKEKTNSGGLPDKVRVHYHKKEKGQPDTNTETIDYPKEDSTLLVGLDVATYIVWTVPENSEGSGTPSDKVEGMPYVPTTTAAPTTTPNITNITVVVAKSVMRDKEFYSELWFIILIALILLILLIALIICAVMNNGNAGRYPVGQKEKKYGGWDNNQQLQDYSDNPMDKPNGMPFNSYIAFDQGNPTHHIIRDKPSMRSVSDSSIAKVPILDDCDNDDDSIDFYQEDNKFNEDGSFIGEYGDEKQSYTNNALL